MPRQLLFSVLGDSGDPIKAEGGDSERPLITLRGHLQNQITVSEPGIVSEAEAARECHQRLFSRILIFLTCNQFCFSIMISPFFYRPRCARKLCCQNKQKAVQLMSIRTIRNWVVCVAVLRHLPPGSAPS
jgi:hypothetical protein